MAAKKAGPFKQRRLKIGPAKMVFEDSGLTGDAENSSESDNGEEYAADDARYYGWFILERQLNH